MIADLTPSELAVPQVELLEKMLSPVFHLRQDDGEDLGDDIEEAFEDAGEAISDAFEDAGNALAPHSKPKEQHDLDENELWAMIAEILIGFGIACELIGSLIYPFSYWVFIVNFILSLGAAGVYVWAVLKYVDYYNEPTAATAFRSWQVNYVNFWVALGVSLIYIILSFSVWGRTDGLSWMWIAGFVGLAA